MSEISTVAQVRAAFYRLLSTDETDGALDVHDEETNEIADSYLTRGFRAGQRWMLKNGYQGWRKRSGAISWTGSDDTTGGRYVDLTTLCVNADDNPDFLRAYGDRRRSALVEANGDRWGMLIEADEDDRKGNFFYIRGDELWIARTAQPPTTLYLDYHHLHPPFDDDVTIDFPLEARSLGITEAAWEAVDEGWFPFGEPEERKIEKALMKARDRARDMSRGTKAAREIRRPRRYGNRW